MVEVYTLPTIAEDESVFGIAGDWHGNWKWAVPLIGKLGESGVKTIFSLGDFNIWHGAGGDEYLGKIRRALENYDMTIYVTLGNHENYNMVDSRVSDEMGIKWFRPNIGVLPRVFRFEHRGIQFLSLGGAPSVDFEYRSRGTDWWLQEMLTDEQVDEAIAGGPADIMLAHDAPDNGTRSVQSIVSENPMGWSDTALAYAAVGRNRMTRAVQSIKPQVFMHGHYHTRDSGVLSYGDTWEESGTIHSLHCDGFVGNVVTVDTNNIHEVKAVEL